MKWRGFGGFRRGGWWGQKEEDCRGQKQGDWESVWKWGLKEGHLGTLLQWKGKGLRGKTKRKALGMIKGRAFGHCR